jgi:hypothetical protein
MPLNQVAVVSEVMTPNDIIGDLSGQKNQKDCKQSEK